MSMVIGIPELLSPDLLIAVGFIGGLIKGALGSLFGGGSSSKSKSGPPAYAQEAGRALLDYALGRESDATANLPAGADLLAAAGPTFGKELSVPGVNWLDALRGGDGGGGMVGFGSHQVSPLSDIFSRVAKRDTRRKMPKTEKKPGVGTGMMDPGYQMYLKMMGMEPGMGSYARWNQMRGGS